MLNSIGIGLLFLAWVQPLHIPPWVSWHSEVLVFLAVVLLSLNVLRQVSTEGRPVVIVPRAILWVLVLVALILVQLGTGQIAFFGDGFILLLYCFLCIAALTIGMNSVSLNGLAIGLLLGAVCSVLIALTQAFDVWESVTWIVRPLGVRRPGANLSQPNQLATLILMGVASLVYLFESRYLSRKLAGVVMILLLMGLAITESRSGVVSFVLMGIWVFVFKRPLIFRTNSLAVLASILGLFALMWVWPPLVSVMQDGGWTEGAAAQHVNVSVGSRMVVWPQIMEAVMQRPWFGWGLREVSEAHNAVLHGYSAGEPFTYAHNIVLDMAVGVGLPMTLLLTVVVLVWTVRRAFAIKSLVPWYCIALLLPFTVHSMLEFPFAYAYFLLPVMIVVGVLERVTSTGPVFRIPRWAAASVLASASLVMAWSAWEYVQAEEDFRVVRFEVRNLGKTPSDYERPHVVLLTQLDALLEVLRIVPQPNMSPDRIELSRKVAMRFPWAATQNRYALALALNGSSGEARRQLQVMRAMHGEGILRGMMDHWRTLADTKYPQLQEFVTP